jgi:hypothetical protein
VCAGSASCDPTRAAHGGDCVRDTHESQNTLVLNRRGCRLRFGWRV